MTAPSRLAAARSAPVFAWPASAGRARAADAASVRKLRLLVCSNMRSSLLIERDPETDMAGRAVRSGAGARGDAVAMAVRRVAEIGAALQRALPLGSGRVVASPGGARQRADAERVRAPFPAIADHVEQSEAVRGERLHRR